MRSRRRLLPEIKGGAVSFAIAKSFETAFAWKTVSANFRAAVRMADAEAHKALHGGATSGDPFDNKERDGGKQQDMYKAALAEKHRD